MKQLTSPYTIFFPRCLARSLPRLLAAWRVLVPLLCRLARLGGPMAESTWWGRMGLVGHAPTAPSGRLLSKTAATL